MMTKVIKIELEIEDDEFEELMEHELIQGDLHSFLFADLCQNYGMGFLTHFSIGKVNKERE